MSRINERYLASSIGAHSVNESQNHFADGSLADHQLIYDIQHNELLNSGEGSQRRSLEGIPVFQHHQQNGSRMSVNQEPMSLNELIHNQDQQEEYRLHRVKESPGSQSKSVRGSRIISKKQSSGFDHNKTNSVRSSQVLVYSQSSRGAAELPLQLKSSQELIMSKSQHFGQLDQMNYSQIHGDVHESQHHVHNDIDLDLDQNQLNQDSHHQIQYNPEKFQQQCDPEEQEIQNSSSEPVNICISARQQKLSNLLERLRKIIKKTRHINPKSFDILVGEDIESDLMQLDEDSPIPEGLKAKCEAFIQEQERKFKEFKVNQVFQSALGSVLSPKSQTKPIKKQNIQSLTSPKVLPSQPRREQRKFEQLDDNQKQIYKQLVSNFEHSLSKISAKEVTRFKTLPGKNKEFPIGLACLYLIATYEKSIILTNDRKFIANQSWDEVRRQFANSGKIVTQFKKLREYIEQDLVMNIHLSQVSQLLDSIMNSNAQFDSIVDIFLSFIQDAMALSKFVKSKKGQNLAELIKSPERQSVKSPLRKIVNAIHYATNITSPKRQQLVKKERLMSPTIQRVTSPISLKKEQSPQRTERSNMRNMATSTASSRQNLLSDQKKRLLSPQSNRFDQSTDQTFQRESQDLQQYSARKEELLNQRRQLLKVQQSVSRLKFELAQEEKLQLKEKEQIKLQQEIEFQRLEHLKAEALARQQRSQALLQQKIRAQQKVEEQRLARQMQRNDADRERRELSWGVDQEKQFKIDSERKKWLEQVRIIQQKKDDIKEAERIEREKAAERRRIEQEAREAERQGQLEKERKDLEARERALLAEIELLSKMKNKPVKI